MSTIGQIVHTFALISSSSCCISSGSSEWICCIKASAMLTCEDW